MNEQDSRTRKPGRNTFDSANTRYSLQRILESLLTPCTYGQLAASLHMSDRSVRRYITHLRAEPNRRVRVKSFQPIPNGHIPVFALGSAPDAVRPRQGEIARNAKYRAKVKATPELRERATRQSSARWMLTKAKRSPNTWASALFIGVRVPVMNVEG
jgi:hypothetical protein